MNKNVNVETEECVKRLPAAASALRGGMGTNASIVSAMFTSVFLEFYFLETEEKVSHSCCPCIYLH